MSTRLDIDKSSVLLITYVHGEKSHFIFLVRGVELRLEIDICCVRYKNMYIDSRSKTVEPKVNT